MKKLYTVLITISFLGEINSQITSDSISVISHWSEPNLHVVSSNLNNNLLGVALFLDGVAFVDATNPANLETKSFYDLDGYTRSVVLIDGYAFVNNNGPGGLKILDVNNPSQPFEITHNLPISNVQDIEVRGNYLYLVSYGKFNIIDVSNPEEPILLSNVSITSDNRALEVYGNFAYVIYYVYGTWNLMTIDVSNPTLPEVVDIDYSLHNEYNTLEANESTLYLCGDDIHLFDISNPSDPTSSTWYNIYANDIKFDNNYIYVATMEDEGVRVFDSYFDNEVAYFYLSTSQQIKSLEIYDRLIYASWGDEGLYILKNDFILSVDQTGGDYETICEYSLNQNYPNPFNPSTTIKYQIPEISFVNIKVYDVLGNEITILVNEEKSVGSYEVEFYGTGIVSGIYFYRLQAGSFVETKKMVILK